MTVLRLAMRGAPLALASSLRQRRHKTPDEVRRQRPGLGAVEGVHDRVETLGVGEAVALADVIAERLTQRSAVVVRHLRRLAPGGAELGELAGLAEVQEVPPDFGA